MGLLRRDAGLGGTRYRMREKLFAIGDDFWIETEGGQHAFKVDGKALRIRSTFILEGPSGEELFKVQEKKLRVRDTMAIERYGKTVATIKKALVAPLRDRFTIKLDDGGEPSAKGNIVDQRKEAEATLRMSEERLRLVLDTAHEAFVSMDTGGLITAWNPAAEATFGWSHEEAIGGRLSEMIIPPEYREAHRRGMKRFLATGEGPVLGKRLELEAVHRDGRRFPVELTISPVRTGPTYFFHAFLRDVTERKRVEAELQYALEMERRAAERLRDLDRLKDEFLTTVSHELRTPLTVISGFAEVLSSEKTSAAMRPELVEGISRYAFEMHAMIEQLLDYSRLEAGKITLKPGPLPLQNEALRCIETIREMVGSHRFAVDVPSDLEAWADERAFERIVVNLLTNAAKYSPEGSTIRVGARAQNGHVVVSVRDEGIGIPPEEHERIFERFYQGATVSGRRGSGIGLSIARRYVELQGGRVWVESEPGRGSAFYFTLPRPAEAARSIQ